MKIVESKPSIKMSKKKKSEPNYSSWDPLTQAKYLYDLGSATGEKITMTEAYEEASRAVLGSANAEV